MASRLRAGLALLPGLGFSREATVQLAVAAEELIQEPEEFAMFLRFRSEWPTRKVDAPEFRCPLWGALAVVDAFPEVVATHAERGFPRAVTARTLRDLERRMREYRERNVEWGFNSLAWMRSHVTSSLFELGSLQFTPGKWREIFTVYRASRPSGMWAVAHQGIAFDTEGWPQETSRAFVTTLRVEDGRICGHASDPSTGAISRAAAALPTSAREVVGSGDPVLHVHIPCGTSLTPDACLASLREARIFFDRHFPDIRFHAICCRTWLLDRALERVLPETSNILAFGRLFHPLAVANANGSQHIERIFGRGVDYHSFTPKTSLQASAQTFLANGGRFRLAAGFVLWEDLL